MSQGKVFLLYQFRIQPHLHPKFQSWAQEHGMHFWEEYDCITRYRTFRQINTELLQPYLSGQLNLVHGYSQVEATSLESLEKILRSTKFQEIQDQFLRFVEPGSLSYSLSECAYDSLRQH